MNKAVLIDSHSLRPLPKALWNYVCIHCGKRQSKWEMLQIDCGELAAMCSVCLLYESAWSSELREDIDNLIASIESERGATFERDRNQKLLPVWADQVMSSVVLTSRMFWMADRAKTLRTGKVK